MQNYTGLEDKDVLVLGLAKSGYEAAKLLTKLGAIVTVMMAKIYLKIHMQKTWKQWVLQSLAVDIHCHY